MIDISHTTEDGTEYTITVDYVYTDSPKELAADPNDSCADESELEIKMFKVDPAPGMKDWPGIIDDFREDEPLYERAADMAINDYFGR